MITAHLPAGYVLGKARGWSGPILVAALIGATWPDIDLLFFYFVDGRTVHHHHYWVHAPAFALVVTAALLYSAKTFYPTAEKLVLAFGAGWLLHIFLDWPVGGVMWLWPIDDRLFNLIAVPATKPMWLMSFIFHWSFWLEILIWAVASLVWLKGRP